MNQTVIAVLSAAVVALVVAGIGLALVRRGQKPDESEELVSSADRLAEAQVSPFGPNEPLPTAPPEHVTDAELISPGVPVWSGGTQSGAPAPTPEGDAAEAMFPPPPPAPLLDPEPPVVAETQAGETPEGVYDPEEVLQELRATPPPILEPEVEVPFEAESFGAEPLEAESFEAESFGAEPFEAESFEAEPFEAEPFEAESFEAEPFEAESFEAEPFEAEPFEQRSDPPIWAPPSADGLPPKVLHISVLSSQLAAGVETEWFLLTPVEALGSWPASGAADPSPPSPGMTPAAAMAPTAAMTQAPAAAPSWSTTAPPAPPTPPAPPPSPVPPPSQESVQLPDSLLADLLGGDVDDSPN